jgi:hypothetical protein
MANKFEQVNQLPASAILLKIEVTEIFVDDVFPATPNALDIGVAALNACPRILLVGRGVA